MYHIAHEPTTTESYDITLYCTLFLSALLIPHKNIVPQSHHFYISFFSQPLEVNLYWSPVLEGNETKRNETQRSQLPVNHSLNYVSVCTYSDLLFCHTNPTPLLPFPLLFFSSLMMISKREGGDLEKVREVIRGCIRGYAPAKGVLLY